MADFSDDLNEHVIVERKFLHDLSNMLLISQGMASIVRKKLDAIPDIDEALLDKMDKSLNASDRMVECIKAHRGLLHSINSD